MDIFRGVLIICNLLCLCISCDGSSVIRLVFFSIVWRNRKCGIDNVIWCFVLSLVSVWLVGFRKLLLLGEMIVCLRW